MLPAAMSSHFPYRL